MLGLSHNLELLIFLGKHWLLVAVLLLPPMQPSPVLATKPPAPVESFYLPAPIATSDLEPIAAVLKASPEAIPVLAVTTPDSGAGGAKGFIYDKESGNNPAKWNSSGCVGLGQSCPASKLLAVCPSLDYACEDQFFETYMSQRYGTWDAAKAHWLARVPIGGKDVGNWW